MQRVLEYCISQQSAPILQLIVESGSELLRDQFGNYVVQHVIECGPSDARSSLLKLMCGDLPELAVHKFASNVVEKVSDLALNEYIYAFLFLEQVLRSSSPIEVVPLIAEFLTPKRHGAPVPLQTVMRDQFGNYVIQVGTLLAL
jgi:pumilio RNA-binding family